jgi:hypothetical protein
MSKKSNKEKLGIIQSRGLGDIVIAIPIAKRYHDQGFEIYWPICEEFLGNVKNTVPWIHWIPIPADSGTFFYDVPMERLRNLKVENAICLYQALTGHPELVARPEFQITKFDQLKYHAAGVPFIEKWRLSECITRNPQREQALKENLGIQPEEKYVVVHLEGSNHKASFDPSWIPEGWRTIEVTAQTDCVFDWLSVLEGAQAIIAVDSIISNIVDLLKITETVDCYFIPRSHIHLTPVLGGTWTVLDPGEEVKKRIQIFRSS